ncbi:hypothetical protein DENIS_3109 [Desulfonema ishimotonii]|uniref:Uncharacterized protein n=1 Tax=Desulfonema ishimotonii TaxID=45657 RepID=A0A401FYY3_9BACT|nr:hypothetical protein DENIS_3109 [Desulfonema ishimotonii]
MPGLPLRERWNFSHIVPTLCVGTHDCDAPASREQGPGRHSLSDNGTRSVRLGIPTQSVGTPNTESVR